MPPIIPSERPPSRAGEGRRRISVITPFLNEAQNLPEFRARWEATARQSGDEFEFVLVDDHSDDGSGELVKAWQREDPRVKYVRLSRNCGSHAAFAAGLSFCTGDCAVFMAADLQDPPELLAQLTDKWREGYDVVWAARSRREGESWKTRLTAGVAYRILRAVALPSLHPKGADFMLLGRKVVDALNAIPEKHTSLVAMIHWVGFRQTTIEYVKQARLAGRSKWTLAKKIKLFADTLLSFSDLPIRLVTLLGCAMTAGGFLYAAVVLAFRVAGRVVAEAGFAALLTVLLVGQGAILLALGVLGEYLWRTYDEARGRPRFIVEQYLGPDPRE